MTKLTVCCDAPGCGWQQKISDQDAERWHNAPCPKCGTAPILSDDDMTALNGVRAMVRDIVAAGGVLVEEDAPAPADTVAEMRLSFNTRALRDERGAPRSTTTNRKED